MIELFAVALASPLEYVAVGRQGGQDMRSVLIATGVGLLASISGACVFGDDDDDGLTLVPTATIVAATETATTGPTQVPTAAPTATATTTTTPSIPTTYTVQAGDHLAAIAEMFGTTAQVLAALNGIDDPDLIFVGQVLQLPTPD